MIILSILTVIAFSHKDFRHTQQVNSDRYRFGSITKRLVSNVIGDSFVEAFTDLKDLQEPFRDPFKKYRDANLRNDQLLTLEQKIELGIVTDADLNSYSVRIHELPNFIIDHVQIPHQDQETDIDTPYMKL